MLPSAKLCVRCCDRGCQKKIWKKKNDDDDNDVDVNTKKLVQQDLNRLYTGDQIAGHYVYAQNYTYLWCVLMYSTGLPILYPFACVFYFVLYWVYKWLLLKFYARTTKFNQDIPIKSVPWIKVGLFYHLVVGSFMLSNNRFFPHETKSTVKKYAAYDLSDLGYDKANFFLNQYFNRMAKGEQGSIYLAFICLLIVFIVLKNTIISWSIDFCKGLYNCLAKCCRCGKKHEVKSKDIYKEYTIMSLENMYVKAMKDIEEFGESAEEFKEMFVTMKGVRFPEETATDEEEVRNVLAARKRQIELVIDDHLLHLHGEEELSRYP